MGKAKSVTVSKSNHFPPHCAEQGAKHGRVLSIWQCEVNLKFSTFDRVCVYVHVHKTNCFNNGVFIFIFKEECTDQFVTDGHFQNSQSLKVCEKLVVRCDDLLYDLLWGIYSLSVLKVNKIWLPWLLSYIRIHEMFNVTDGRDRNLGVDFLLLVCYFYLKSSHSPNILNCRC